MNMGSAKGKAFRIEIIQNKMEPLELQKCFRIHLMVGDLNFKIHNFSMLKEWSVTHPKYMITLSWMNSTQGIMIPIWHPMTIHSEERILYSNLSETAWGALEHVEALIADQMKQFMCNEWIK